MSAIQQDDAANARSPMRAWQYAVLVALAFIGLAGLYLIVRGTSLWHSSTPKPIAHYDAALSGSYVGPPGDLQQVAAKPVSTQQVVRPAPPPIDENAAFNAPIDGQNGAVPMTPRMAPEQQHEQQEAMASRIGGGSLLLATAKAYRVKNPTMTIRKGTLIPCTDVTVVDTGAGGNVLVKATVPMDVWGMDHHMVLLDKGTDLLGEVGHAMVDGLDRIGIVWREATTPPPNGVGVSFDSPAAGPLGEGGLDGDVNRHEWQKIKGVLLFTAIQGATNILQSALASRGTTSINFGQVNTGGQEIGSILLQHMLNIPDTIHRDQGLQCTAFLARDLDFSDVYSLKVTR
jgi:type IV secretory pathway VirB10-like protein